MTAAKIPVTILGATGTVGQKFVRLLEAHPWFEIASVAARPLASQVPRPCSQVSSSRSGT